jgi:DNA-binding transcriptional MerR regulator
VPIRPIPNKLFFKIGEVCELAGVEPFVLRFWESEFPSLAPTKSKAGHRVYRRKDVEMVLKIKSLLYDRGFTIAGARKQLAKGAPVPREDRDQALARVRDELRDILTLLKGKT